MIVSLDYHDTVCIKKDTPIAYIHEEDVPCEYLEVNEIVESTQCINWQPPHNHKIVNSELVLLSCTDHRASQSGA